MTVVALDNPKTGANVGGAMRACQVFGASMVIVSGERVKNLIRHPTDTMKAYRHIPVVCVNDVFDALPFNCVPVAVDLVPGAVSLHTYEHPRSACYVFGAEDATLGTRLLGRCRDRVMVPMVMGCMNLAASVNVVLYDRSMKARGR